MIDTAIIPVAGLGTRMLPITKEQPKEMLPVPLKSPKYGLIFVPFVHIIFENLYDAGIRRFIFIVGRGKRSIENYFTPDWNYLEYLESKGKKREANILRDFYNKIQDSQLIWVNQPEPQGFGDAVYRGSLLIGNKPFLVHAGDITLVNICGKAPQYLKILIKAYSEHEFDTLILVRRVEDPRHYGIVLVERQEVKTSYNLYKVERVIEKPKTPVSNLAIAAVYIFKPVIQKALEKLETELNSNGEIELTDAIQYLIDWGYTVYALEVNKCEKLVDIGRPEEYIRSIQLLSNIK